MEKTLGPAALGEPPGGFLIVEIDADREPDDADLRVAAFDVAARPILPGEAGKAGARRA